jgi:hypothetical protein
MKFYQAVQKLLMGDTKQRQARWRFDKPILFFLKVG